jgi:hypothetical protein
MMEKMDDNLEELATPSNITVDDDVSASFSHRTAAGLPLDCWNVILSFLNMKDCLMFGCASKITLRDVQEDLQRRQKRMIQSFAYYDGCGDEKGHCQGDDEEDDDQSMETAVKEWKLVGPVNLSDRDTKKRQTQHGKILHLFPTVRDQVEVLFRNISLSHPLAGSVRDLRNELLDPSRSSSLGVDRAMRDEEDDNAFFVALSSMIKLTRSHRMHAYILKRAMESSPTHWERGYSGARSHYRQPSNSSNVGGGNILTVTLERYLGDVLIVYCLMGHVAAGIVDSPISETDWMNSVLQDLQRQGRQQQPQQGLSIAACNSFRLVTTPATTLYRAWILLHSTLLRTAAFTGDQQMLLNIATIVQDKANGNDITTATTSSALLRPHKPFAGCRKFKYIQLLRTMDSLEPIRITFNDFGRLGPTFRGRDLIQSHTVDANSCLDAIVAFEQLTKDDAIYDCDRPLNSIPPFLRSWILGDSSTWIWLKEMHTEGAKVRPLTVTPPLVTVRCTGEYLLS